VHGLPASDGVQLPRPASAAISPCDILRFIVTACPELADRAEAEVAAHEVRTVALAWPATGIRACAKMTSCAPHIVLPAAIEEVHPKRDDA
jgi:hypothetical protein